MRNVGTLAVVWGLLGSSCLSGGCSAPGSPEEWELQKQKAQQTMDLAKESGAIAVVQLDHDGKVGVYAEENVGLDLGAGLHATLVMVPGLMELIDALKEALGQPPAPRPTDH